MTFTVEILHENGWGLLTRCPCAWSARTEVEYLGSIGLQARAVDLKGNVLCESGTDDQDHTTQTETDSIANESVAMEPQK